MNGKFVRVNAKLFLFIFDIQKQDLEYYDGLSRQIWPILTLVFINFGMHEYLYFIFRLITHF